MAHNYTQKVFINIDVCVCTTWPKVRCRFMFIREPAPKVHLLFDSEVRRSCSPGLEPGCFFGISNTKTMYSILYV